MSNGFDPNQPRNEDGEWTVAGAAARKGAGLSEDSQWDEFKRKYDTEGKPFAAGKVSIIAYRYGEVHVENKRGVAFGSDIQSIEMYSSDSDDVKRELHKYHIYASNVLVAGTQNSASQMLMGKSYSDVVAKYDFDVNFERSGGEIFDERIARKLRGAGYDAIIYTAPWAPAKYEIIVVGKRVKIGVLE